MRKDGGVRPFVMLRSQIICYYQHIYIQINTPSLFAVCVLCKSDSDKMGNSRSKTENAIDSNSFELKSESDVLKFEKIRNEQIEK